MTTERVSGMDTKVRISNWLVRWFDRGPTDRKSAAGHERRVVKAEHEAAGQAAPRWPGQGEGLVAGAATPRERGARLRSAQATREDSLRSALWPLQGI